MDDFKTKESEEPTKPKSTLSNNQPAQKESYRNSSRMTPRDAVFAVIISLLAIIYLVTFWEDGLLLELLFYYFNKH